MKRRLVLLGPLLLLAALAACSRGGKLASVSELIADPEKYSGRTVTVEGIYFHGWEVVVLAEKLVPSGFRPGHLVPDSYKIWVEGGLSNEVFSKLYTQNQSAGYPERFGKVRIKGKFESGGKYGHLGGYSMHIIPEDATLLDWSPPPGS